MGRMKFAAPAALGAFLAGCAGAGAPVGAPPPASLCVHVQGWSKADRNRFIAAEEAAAKNPVTAPVLKEVEDYDRMRREAEACAEAAKGR